jgi:hypothetical protein
VRHGLDDLEVTMRTRSLATLLVTAFLAASPPVLAAGPAAGAALRAPAAVAPGTFSTAGRTKHRSPFPAPVVTAVRVVQHRHYDRVVLRLTGRAPGFDVRYVHRLHRDPSGKRVNLLGPASLKIALSPANGHDPVTGDETVTTPARTAWRLDQVRETAVIGDFEAVFTLGVGLAHRAPFRVRTLHHPTRIVIDVRH